MEEFIQKQTKIMEKRKSNDKRLIKDGARMVVNRNHQTRLELTKKQETEAIVEMRLNKFYKKEYPPVIVQVAKNFEIGESRVFSEQQIIAKIAEADEVNPEYLRVTEKIINSNNEIIAATIRLEEEEAIAIYNSFIEYLFKIKGENRPKNKKYQHRIPETTIEILYEGERDIESMIRRQIEKDYAETEDEKAVAKNLEEESEQNLEVITLLKFNGIEWEFATKDEDAEEDL